MAYVTDFTKTPVQMLLGLINSDNNKGYLESDCEILAPVALGTPDEGGRDTSIQIDLETLPSEVQDDFVTFFYERVALDVLFGEIAPTFREVDVELNENGLPVSASDFYNEIFRKFGVRMNETDFEYTLAEAGVITVAAVATNVAYKGNFDIAVQSSMVSRVQTTELDGFVAPTPAE